VATREKGWQRTRRRSHMVMKEKRYEEAERSVQEPNKVG
jgi:hypothetical protein